MHVWRTHSEKKKKKKSTADWLTTTKAHKWLTISRVQRKLAYELSTSLNTEAPKTTAKWTEDEAQPPIIYSIMQGHRGRAQPRYSQREVDGGMGNAPSNVSVIPEVVFMFTTAEKKPRCRRHVEWLYSRYQSGVSACWLREANTDSSKQLSFH